jgi:hypothetical protein
MLLTRVDNGHLSESGDDERNRIAERQDRPFTDPAPVFLSFLESSYCSCAPQPAVTLLWISRLCEEMTNFKNTRVFIVPAAIIVLSGILTLLAEME